MAQDDREAASLRRRVVELEGKLGSAQARIRHGERERERYASDLEWFNNELAVRSDELARARKELTEARKRLSELNEEQTEIRRFRGQAAEARRQQRRWARHARALELSRSWRIGSFLVRAFRLLTLRRPASPQGPAELAASIEKYMDSVETQPPIAETREQQRRTETSWARTARHIELSRSWRIGSFLVRAFRLLTLRRPASPHGPAELAASIESAYRDREQSTPDERPQVEVAHPKADPPFVSVVTVFLDAERFLEDALQSVLAQDYPNWELFLVDDGSNDRSRELAQRFASRHPAICYLEHPGHENRGIGASRNLGLAHARGKYLICLDSDDALLPDTMSRLVSTLEERPQAAMAYGSSEWWRSWEDGEQADWSDEVGKVPHPNSLIDPPELLIHFLRGAVPCWCSVAFRTQVLREVGGFDESLRDPLRDLYEDQVIYSKILLEKPVFVTDSVLGRYRQHADQVCVRADDATARAARIRFLRWLSEYIEERAVEDAALRSGLEDEIRGLAIASSKQPEGTLPPSRPAPVPVQKGSVNLGDLRRLEPLSRVWGFDRGRPIDRYYIERFLEPRSAAIRGRVLEIAEPLYTDMFGGERVMQSDILDVMNPDATYTCGLEEGDEIPSDSFDCIVLTQTLQLIYDFRGALRTCHRILKPGGALLATVPGITRLSREEYEDAWYWSFTGASIRGLFSELFPRDAFDVEVFGNILAATAFLYGLADSELTREELDYRDPDYEVTIGVQAIK